MALGPTDCEREAVNGACKKLGTGSGHGEFFADSTNCLAGNNRIINDGCTDGGAVGIGRNRTQETGPRQSSDNGALGNSRVGGKGAMMEVPTLLLSDGHPDLIEAHYMLLLGY